MERVEELGRKVWGGRVGMRRGKERKGQDRREVKMKG